MACFYKQYSYYKCWFEEANGGKSPAKRCLFVIAPLFSKLFIIPLELERERERWRVVWTVLRRWFAVESVKPDGNYDVASPFATRNWTAIRRAVLTNGWVSSWYSHILLYVNFLIVVHNPKSNWAYPFYLPKCSSISQFVMQLCVI